MITRSPSLSVNRLLFWLDTGCVSFDHYPDPPDLRPWLSLFRNIQTFALRTPDLNETYHNEKEMEDLRLYTQGIMQWVAGVSSITQFDFGDAWIDGEAFDELYRAQKERNISMIFTAKSRIYYGVRFQPIPEALLGKPVTYHDFQREFWPRTPDLWE